MLEALAGRINLGPAPPGPGDWVSLGSGAVSYLGRAVAFNGEIFIFGGRLPSTPPTNAIRKYNIAAKTWTTVGTLPWAAESSVAVVIGNLIYVYGGGNGSTRFGNTVSFNPSNNAIVTLAPGLAMAASSAVVYDNKMYVFGGNTTTTSNALRYYNPIDNTWNTVTPNGTLPLTRYYHDAVVIGGKMYVPGGGSFGTGLTWAKTLDAYDFATNTWEAPIPLTFGVYAYAIARIGKRIYLVGGVEEANGGTYVDTVRIYDTETKAWTLGKPYFKKIAYQQGAVESNQLYCFGGFTISSGAPVADAAFYTPT